MGNSVSDTIFEAMKPDGPLSVPGHVFRTTATGWNEPQRLFAVCSCGVSATPVEEDFGDKGPSLIKSLVPFVEKYGREALLLGEGIYGDWETLARQCIGHMEAMGGTVDERIADTLERVKSASETLQAELAGNFSKGAQGHPLLSAAALSAAAQDLEALTVAQELKERMPFPEPVPITPEIAAAYEDALEAEYPGWHARIEADRKSLADG